MPAQNQPSAGWFETFDNQVGQKNLAINNGTIHSNLFKPANNSHRYLLDQYSAGNVFYDGQWYPGHPLKYDLYLDNLIAKVDGQNNNTGINLITSKVDYFEMDGKKFVNLNRYDGARALAKGFYEEVAVGAQCQLYVKHQKERQEIVRSDGTFSKFTPAESFVLQRNGVWYAIQSQSSVVAVFPDFQKNIAAFYEANGNLRSTDPKQFMKNLIQHLQSLTQNGNR
ncbi:hypothetical protein [Flavobacterium sp.]|uniref:hypothetical protein n=1 Tax=Flavobacterium sp. TaxID=239 RepID=UPI0039E639B5